MSIPQLTPLVVADDDPVSREMVARRSAGAGHQVEVAADGLQAWKLIESQSPSLAILDWDMPGLSGLDVLRRPRGASRRHALCRAADGQHRGRDRGCTACTKAPTTT